jgi:hypothetical protein
MGVYADLLANTQVHSAAKPRSGYDRATYEWLYAKSQVLDPALPTTYAAKTAVGKIAAQTGTPTGGTYTITVTVPTYNNGRSLTYTTAAIAYNATAATIQAALDTASPAGERRWPQRRLLHVHMRARTRQPSAYSGRD